MSRWLTDRHTLHIGAEYISLVSLGSGPSRDDATTKLPTVWRDSVASIIENARTLIEASSQRVRQVSVILESVHVRAFSFEVPASLSRLGDINALAHARFAQLFNVHDDTWLVVVGFTSAKYVAAFAVRRDLHEGLVRLSEEARFELRSIKPAAAVAALHAISHHFSTPSWLVSFGSQNVTVMFAGNGTLIVHQEFVAAREGIEADITESVLPRIALAHCVDDATKPWLFDEAAIGNPAQSNKTLPKAIRPSLKLRRRSSPPAGLAAIARVDFLQTLQLRARNKVIGLALALLCVLPLIWASSDLLTCHASIEKISNEYEHIVHTARTVAQPPVVAAALTTRQVDTINRAISNLNLPWDLILHGVAVASKGEVAILSLRPDSANNEMTGVAEAANTGNMLDFVNRLRLQNPFENAFLTAHEVVDRDPAKPMRFEFRARWAN